MLALLVAVIVSQSTTAKPIRIQDEGVTIGQGWIGTINCVGSSVTCTRNASTGVGTLTISGGGGGGLPDGGGVGADIPVVTYTSSGDLTAERVLTAGTNIALSTATPGQLGVSVTGTVSSATTATQLAADPTACGGGQYVTDISAAGALTCSTPPGTYTLPDSTSGVTGGIRLTGDLSGTATSPSVVDDSHAHTASTISGLDVGDITTGTLPQARGGTGAGALTCGAGQFLTSNGTAYSCGTPTSPVTYEVTTSNITNSTTTPTTVLSWSIAAGQELGFTCIITASGTATSLPRYNISGPASPTTVSFVTERFTTTSAQTLLVLQAFSATAQTAACTTSCNTTVLPMKVHGTILNGSNAGTVSLQVASSTAGQTVTVYRGSTCFVN